MVNSISSPRNISAGVIFSLGSSPSPVTVAMRAPKEILFDTNALKVRTSAQHVDFLMLGLELDRLTPDFLREAPPER